MWLQLWFRAAASKLLDLCDAAGVGSRAVGCGSFSAMYVNNLYIIQNQNEVGTRRKPPCQLARDARLNWQEHDSHKCACAKERMRVCVGAN